MRVIRRFAAIPVLAAVLALAAVAPARAAADQGGVAVADGPPPHLLLLHGGSFLFEDPFFHAETIAPALAAGFVPHYVAYPLKNLPLAVDRVREEARRLRERFGRDRVYVYGSSAGGTLAALLTGDGLVDAGFAKAPISDLATWTWPLGKYGPDYYAQLGVDTAGRRRLSPLRRPDRSPLLIYQGGGDGVVPPAMNMAYAKKFRRVHLRVVPGGHTTERLRPRLIGQAMHWLARTAKLAARAEEGSENAGRQPGSSDGTKR